MSSSKYSLQPSDIDASRGVMILFVVYGHALALFIGPHEAPLDTAFSQYQVLASFGMPFFFFVSGLVYRAKTHRKAFTSSLTLLLMAYACHAAGWLLASLQNGISLRALLLPLVKTVDLMPVAVWFLVAMAFVQLAYHFYERSSRNTRLLIAAGLVALFAAAVVSRKNPFAVAAWAPGMLFLACGHALGKSGWLSREPSHNWQRWLLLAALLVATAALAPLNRGCLLDPVASCPYPNGSFSVFLMDGNLGFLPLFLLSAVIGSYGLWLLARQLSGGSAWVGLRLARIGRYSLALFTLNAFVLVFVQPYLQRLLPDELPLWLVFAAPLVLSVVQVMVLPWWRPFNDTLLKWSGRGAKWIVDRWLKATAPASAKQQAQSEAPDERATRHQGAQAD